MTAPPAWMIEAARRRRRRPAPSAANWISDPCAPIPWSEASSVEAFAARMNEPLHRRMVQGLERIGEVEIEGSDTG